MPSAQKYAASIFQAWQVVGTRSEMGEKQNENETKWNDKSCVPVCVCVCVFVCARQAIKWRASGKVFARQKACNNASGSYVYVPHKTSAAMSHCWPKGVEEKLPTPRESLVNLRKELALCLQLKCLYRYENKMKFHISMLFLDRLSCCAQQAVLFYEPLL